MVLGGTRYFGKLLVHKLLTHGDKVWIVTRGNNPIPAGCSFIKFDRNGLNQFASKCHWDVVYDQSCYQSESLKNIEPIIANCGIYVLTSSQAVYSAGLMRASEYATCSCFEEQKINAYGKEKLLAEAFIAKSKDRFIFPRFPVVVGINDPLKRMHILSEKITSGHIDLPKSNPLFQILEQQDAANVLYQLPFTKVNGPINIATKEVVSAERLCYLLADLANVRLKINWLNTYACADFDLIKAESKTLDLSLQTQLDLNLKSIEAILKIVL